jgi:hypothetical protein
MFSGPLPNGFAGPRATIPTNTATKATYLESLPHLIEGVFPASTTRKKDSSIATLSTANGAAARNVVRESWPNN